MWRYLKIMLIVIVVGAIAKTFVTSRLENRADEEIPKLVAQQQAMLPVKLNDNLELTDVSYDNRILHYEASSAVWIDSADMDGHALRQGLTAAYCEKMQAFVNANVAIEYEVKIPPKTLNDRSTRIPFVIHPDDCRSRKTM
jgi:hypothetical protein